MKKILFVALISLVQLNAKAQTTDIFKIADIKLPTDAKPVSRSKIYSSDKESQYSIISSSYDRLNIYEVGNTLMQINAAQGNYDYDILKFNQSQLADYKPISTLFNSNVRTINNAQVLCVQTEIADSARGKYIFVAVNSSNSKIINGVIEYDKTDRDKAAKILERVLHSIRMKK
ncbi:MAG: hypothetical protein V4619_14805 [Bacteroidota bacterium]